MLVASYLFYMSWSIPYGLLILATSLIDYFVGVGLWKIENQQKRKLFLVVSIVANLGVLAFFKYTNFLLDNAWVGLIWLGSVGDLALRHHPPCRHFFFHVPKHDLHDRDVSPHIKPCHSLRDFLFSSRSFRNYWPVPSIEPRICCPNFLTGCGPQSRFRDRTRSVRFRCGQETRHLGPNHASCDLIFSSPGSYDGFTLLQGAIGYAIQIYCDFSGYSDMAIGCARMMGFRFMENFQMPYSSVNITEFWRRWHISLSSWFRDYLYIPLGGNRKGRRAHLHQLLVTMILCGLWHGASWNFVFWGGLHGAALAIHRAWTAWGPLAALEENAAPHLLWTLFSRLLTLGVVLLGWVFFRAQSWSSASIRAQVFVEPEGTRLISPYILPAAAGVFLVHIFMNKDRTWAHEIPFAAPCPSGLRLIPVWPYSWPACRQPTQRRSSISSSRRTDRGGAAIL